jgi:hypothetical protein
MPAEKFGGDSVKILRAGRPLRRPDGNAGVTEAR